MNITKAARLLKTLIVKVPRGDWIIALLLIFITSFLYDFYLRVPLTSILGDTYRYHGYYLYGIKYSLDNFGQVGLWDQLLSSGTSWISNPGGPLFYPPAWLIITFFENLLLGARAFFFIHALTASLAMYFFLRVIGMQKATSFFVAVAAICNQYIILLAINGWFEEFFGFTIIPLTTGLLLLSLKRKSYLFAVLAAFSMSFHFFANTFYVFHYNSIALLIVSIYWGLYLLWENRKNNFSILFKTFFSFLKLQITFWAVFIGISAIKLIPILEFRSLSSRSSFPLSAIETPDLVMTSSFLFERLRNFFVPSGHTNFYTQTANDLAIILLLVSIAYLLLKRSFIYGVFFIMLCIGIWGYLAYRVPVDLYKFLYYFLPGFSSNQYPYRFIIVIHFAFLTCIALGLNLIIRNKHRIFFVPGYIIGFFLFVTLLGYTKNYFNNITFPQENDIHKEMKNKQSSINLVVLSSQIIDSHNPEGRVRSTFGIPNHHILIARIPTTQHFYEKIVTTYEYAVDFKGSTKDSLELTKNRYKLFSVLNARFQLQGTESFEFEGCSKLALLPYNLSEVKQKIRKNEVCRFLENRLEPLVKRKDGGIYFDKDVLPKITVIPNGILLIGDNKFNDYSGFIAKKIMFHPDFDVHTTSLLSGSGKYLDGYDLSTLKQFRAVILVEPKVKDKQKVKKLLDNYQEEGGAVLALKSTWREYENLHKRSDSLFSDEPAWNYSKEDEKALSNLFIKLSPQETKKEEVVINKFTPEDLIFTTKSEKDNQLLQFSDSFYPGWKATIDRKKSPVYMADGLVKGVILPEKGRHIARFYYAPDSFRNGAVISIITLLITLTFLLSYYRKSLVRYTKRIFVVISTVRRYFSDIKNINNINMKIKNKFFKALKTFKNILLNNSNMVLGAIVLFILSYIYLPVFINNVTSGGDLPLYFDTYIKSLSIPHIWNPHWPSGLGGNQTIILPLKFYIQLPIPLLVNSFGLSWEIIEKIFLFGVFLFLSIFSSYFLTRSWIGSLIYTSNTYILMVFTGGQMGIALSYATVPLVLALFIRLFDRFSLPLILATGLIFSLEIIFDQRIAFLSLLAVLIFLALKFVKNPLDLLRIKKRILLISLIPITVLLLNAFWILPLLYSKLVGINALQIIERTPGDVGFFSFAFLENTMSLLHPNFPENIFGKVSFMRPEFLAIPIIAFSSLLFIKLSETIKQSNNRHILFFAFLGLIGAFLAKGTNEPFGEIYVWLFNNFPGFSFFRDPTKFYIFIALSYCVIIPFALREISNKFLENFRAKGFYLLSIVFLIFWIFTIRPVFLNQVGGILKENKIPKEYIELKKQIESEPGFFRTMWMPVRSRFGYFSDTHPSIDGYDLFGRIGEATMAGKLGKQEVLSLLSDMSIKYVIVPFDNKGEIFLSDRKYDESKYEEMVDGLFAIPQLKQVSNFGKLTLLELQNQKDHFFIESANNAPIPQIDYKVISPVKYLVNVNGAKKGDMLVFSESYDLGWQLSSPDVKIFPVPYRNTLNGFVLPDDGDYKFELFYDPQKAGDIGFVISFAALGIILSTLFFLKIRKRSAIF